MVSQLRLRSVLVVLALALVLAAIVAPWTNIPADNADSAGMQAHLHAIFEGRDLLYDDEYEALGMSPLFAFVTEAGVVSNHWPIGASFMQAPGWLLGRVAGLALVGQGVSERAASWTIPLLGLRSWALIVLAGISVFVVRWLRGVVGQRTATLTIAALLGGTPLLYYAAESPLRPHLWGFCVVTILLVRWFAAIEGAIDDPERAHPRLREAIELAVYAGLATAIRPQLAMLAVLVAHERWVASRELPGAARLGLLAGHGLICAGAFAVWPALVLRMQLWMYGGLGDYGGEVSHHLREFLLSTHHGALVWCPVLVIGGLGLAIGAARREPGALLLVALLAAQLWLNAGNREIEPYVVLGTRTWTGGTGFGPRKLVDAMPLLLPGVIWLHRWLAEQSPAQRHIWARRLGAATLLALIPTSVLLLAAWLDPSVCSAVLDGEGLLLAMGLPFDPANWSAAWATRGLPLRISSSVGALVALPLALALALALGLTGAAARAELRWGVGPRSWGVGPRSWAWVLVLVYGLGANGWLLHLQRRSEALLLEDPDRMERAAARMHPWHEALVAEIPRHAAALRERLGP